MQTFKNWCKIATLPILKRQAQPFQAKWLSNVKNCDFQRRMQPFRTIWWPNVKNLRKIVIFWSV